MAAASASIPTPGALSSKLETTKERSERLAAAAAAESGKSASASEEEARAAKERRKARKKNRKKAAKAAAAVTDDADVDGADGDDSGADDSATAKSDTKSNASATGGKAKPARPAARAIIAAPLLPPSAIFQKTEWIDVQSIPGKGKGCIAAKTIEIGACILNEDGIAANFHSARGATEAAAVVAAELLTREDCSDLYFENDSKNGVKLYTAPPEQAAKGISDARWSMAMAQVTTNCFVKKLTEAESAAAFAAMTAAAAKLTPAEAAAARESKTSVVEKGDIVTTTVTPGAPTTAPDQRLVLYPLGARFNHSCWPNAHLVNKNGKSFVYALERIAPGTEITICYRDEFLWLPLKRRRVMLKISHQFDCLCVRCAPHLTPNTAAPTTAATSTTASATASASNAATTVAPGASAAAPTAVVSDAKSGGASASGSGIVPSRAMCDQFLDSTTPSPLSFADNELMEAMFVEAEKVHLAYSTLDDVHSGVDQWAEFVKLYGGKRLHVCHWRMFQARRYLIEALQTLKENDTGGGLSSKHKKLLLSVLREHLECLELIAPPYHNIKVLFFKAYIAISPKLPPALDERWTQLKAFFKL